jgi:hypothetical protein
VAGTPGTKIIPLSPLSSSRLPQLLRDGHLAMTALGQTGKAQGEHMFFWSSPESGLAYPIWFVRMEPAGPCVNRIQQIVHDLWSFCA